MAVVDVDRFIAANQPTWDRLQTLLSRSGTRRGGRRAPDDAVELVKLYQRTSTHLSYARTYLEDPSLTASLTRLVARAGPVVYGTRPRTLRSLGRFFSDTFPAALWRLRPHLACSAALFILPALAVGAWIANSTDALEALAPAAVREAYIEEDFAAYYSSSPAAQFASEVTTNNIQVGILAFAAGILLCLPTAALLVVNGANLGFAAGLFAAAGQQPRFWGLILPHGLLEITAVLVAGATGLLLGWTLVDPGDRPRGSALVEEGRRAVVVVFGLVVMFVVAGLIEGFVTGSALPTWARVAIGSAVEALFCAYAVVRGRAAARLGLTGALGETDPAGWA